MPCYLNKAAPDVDQYVEWSTISDGPVSEVMTREEAVGKHGEERVARTDVTGVSWKDPDLTPRWNSTELVDGWPDVDVPAGTVRHADMCLFTTLLHEQSYRAAADLVTPHTYDDEDED